MVPDFENGSAPVSEKSVYEGITGWSTTA